jgi:deazaflavin-dependent oxidoreductase (nitroreductase family)
MTDNDRGNWEKWLIADMREHDGRPTKGPLAGHPLALMHMTGAKTGQPRQSIVTYSRDGSDYVIAGTAGGAPKDPQWVSNLRANPDVDLEIGTQRVKARAQITSGEERRRLWDQHVEQLPWFGKYPAQTGREIPVIRLTPVD